MNKWLILIAMILLLPIPTHAQGDNLLQNPSFDGALTPVSNGAVPNGWSLWGNPSESDKESLTTLTRSAPYSWRLRKEYGVYTGGGYQTIAVQTGATYRFSIFAMIWTCNDEQFACRNETGTFSHTESGGRVRIGVDPNGGTNPYAGTVQWSGFRSPFSWGTFEYLSMDVVAAGGQLTVFTYYTADQSMRWHDAFWDDAALTMVAPPNTNSNNNTNNNNAPRPTVVANAQNRTDGSQVHIVQSGETLSTIAQAYNIPLQSLREWNNLLNTDIIVTGQALIVRPAPVAASPTPTITSLVQPSPTVTIFSTVVAQFSTPDVEVVLVDSEDSSDGTGLKTGVTILTLIVIVIGVIGVGGVLVIIGVTLFRRG